MISSVLFHEMAEVELNEAVAYYETEVPGFGTVVHPSFSESFDENSCAAFLTALCTPLLEIRFAFSQLQIKSAAPSTGVVGNDLLRCP